MKNITVTMPEDLAAWLRVRAAENGRSEVQQFALDSRRDKAMRNALDSVTPASSR